MGIDLFNGNVKIYIIGLLRMWGECKYVYGVGKGGNGGLKYEIFRKVFYFVKIWGKSFFGN